MVRQTSELPAQRRCEVLLLTTKRLSGRSGCQDSGRVKGKTLCLAHASSVSYRRRAFSAPNIPSVPEKPILSTDGFRKCVAYPRKPFFAPHAYSVPEKALSGTEFCKRQKRGEHCLQRMPQLPEKRSPVQKAQPGMPPRARKSQPKNLQYRPKSAQHLGLSITQDFIICHTVRLGLICRKILKITRQSVMILQINELSFYLFLLALSSLI